MFTILRYIHGQSDEDGEIGVSVIEPEYVCLTDGLYVNKVIHFMVELLLIFITPLPKV